MGPRRTAGIVLAGLMSVAGGTACGQTAATAGGRVVARAWVDSVNYLVGDWITVHVGFSHPRGATFVPLVGDTLGEFHVIDRLPFKPLTDTSTTAGLIVSLYDSAGASLPGMPFRYSLPGDSSVHVAMTNPLFLVVHTVHVDTAQAFKDIKPPFSIPWTLAEIALYVGTALLIAGVAYLIYRYWKKRQQKKTGELYVPPPRPAHIIALEELAALKEKRLWQQGLIKQYYSEVTEVIRRYLENRYRLAALEQTTDEIMEGLKRTNFVPEGVPPQVETMLRRADLVKFAKHQPDTHDHEETLSLAYAIVDRTKLVQMAPATLADAKVPEHAGA